MSHISVMPDEVLSLLDIQPTDVVLDGTLGGAGHSLLMAQKLAPGAGRLICCDVDQKAIEEASVVLSPAFERGIDIDFYHGSFADIYESEEYSAIKVDKILLDLGWSSNQFEDALRGFSFMHDGPLDMRLSFPGLGVTARELLHTLSESELVEILEVFGEERRAKRIAAAIIHERIHGKLETTHDLARTVESVTGKGGKTHPATQTFQALRIVVNHEIEAVMQGIPNLWSMLRSGGRMCVITFHSIEDRIVKRIFAEFVKNHEGVLLNKHVVTPGKLELAQNPRSRSAKIRTIQRI